MKSLTSQIISLDDQANQTSTQKVFDNELIFDEGSEGVATTESDRFRHVAAMREKRRHFIESLSHPKNSKYNNNDKTFPGQHRQFDVDSDNQTIRIQNKNDNLAEPRREQVSNPSSIKLF